MIWVLTGFMGCGKTSIGRLAASLYAGIKFIDLDEEIEKREGRSIPDIFSADGESVFRSIERRTLAELLLAAGHSPFGSSLRSPHPPFGTVPPLSNRGCYVPQGERQLQSSVLISLGGGTLTDEESRKLVRENCKCIYLRASIRTLVDNLKEAGAEGRPLLKLAPGESLEGRICSLMAQRSAIYEKTADIILDIDGLDYSDVADKIFSLEEQTIGR
ncbi:MAG: hypothetical protein IKZ71_04895 [Bacteroidales bacterium]|nr:hypothetical protein [Bacteroidales bacterium]